MSAQGRALLVTGAASPLGRMVVSALCRDERTRAVLAVLGPDEAAPSSRHPRVSYVSIALWRHHPARELLFGRALELAIDTIVHVPAGRDHEREADATRHLLVLAQEQPRIQRFVLRSFSDVYRIERDQPALIDEDHSLDLSAGVRAEVRSHVEADVTTCAKIADARFAIAVLRCAEILAPDVRSPLFDYLGSRVCFRPLGYDPMLNLLSLADASAGIGLAAFADASGVFNLPGYDTLPLSEVVHLCGRAGLPVPGPWLGPLYGLRSRAIGKRFRYAADRERLHYGGILDGRKARRALGYSPQNPLRFDALF